MVDQISKKNVAELETARAYDTGEFRWRVALGEFDELKARGIPKAATLNIGGPVVTAGGLVLTGTRNDGCFRGFDKDPGEEIRVPKLPVSGLGTRLTFLGRIAGRSFVLIAAGGGDK